MIENNKFIEIEGQIQKRIFNPIMKNKEGKEYSISYLVLKWVTGPNGEYEDLVSVKSFEAKHFKDLRAGYIVRLTMKYSCKPKGEIQLRSNTYENITTNSPSIFPEFFLYRNKEIEIINSKENWEQHSSENEIFEKEVIEGKDKPEDDLPF